MPSLVKRPEAQDQKKVPPPPPKKDKCEFEKKHYNRAEHPVYPEITEVMPYYECAKANAGEPCIFPAKMCAYKLQEEGWMDTIVSAAERGLK